MITIGEVLRRSTTYLAERGSDTPRLDAELLLGHALELDRLHLYTESERPLTGAELERARALLARRGRREPLAYIIGTRAFRRISVAVRAGVLVPRPETELLVEWALEVAPVNASVLDWGTGSGAIALALVEERSDLTVVAIDRSPAAVEVARGNAQRLGLAVDIRRSDSFAELDGRRFDVICANPPYLTEQELREAPPELAFEPSEALVAGPRGLEAVERIVADASGFLKPGGWLLLEIGQGQDEATVDLLAAAGFAPRETRCDLAGIPRAVGARCA